MIGYCGYICLLLFVFMWDGTSDIAQETSMICWHIYSLNSLCEKTMLLRLKKTPNRFKKIKIRFGICGSKYSQHRIANLDTHAT